MTVSADFVEQKGLTFELLGPLIEETVKKGLANDPRKSQTGPAKRGDNTTIEKHIRMLKRNPQLANLYRQFSENIQAYYNQ